MYDDASLIEIRRDFMRENRTKDYRRMIRKGTLEEHLKGKAESCAATAQSLVEKGTTHEAQAWQWAIRSDLLETSWD